jgi:hypothetical protein
LAWSDVSVFVQSRKKGRIVCKRIINGGKLSVRVKFCKLDKNAKR